MKPFGRQTFRLKECMKPKRKVISDFAVLFWNRSAKAAFEMIHQRPGLRVYERTVMSETFDLERTLTKTRTEYVMS